MFRFTLFKHNSFNKRRHPSTFSIGPTTPSPHLLTNWSTTSTSPLHTCIGHYINPGRLKYSTTLNSRVETIRDDDDDDVYYPKGRRPREDKEREESYEKQRQRRPIINPPRKTPDSYAAADHPPPDRWRLRRRRALASCHASSSAVWPSGQRRVMSQRLAP